MAESLAPADPAAARAKLDEATPLLLHSAEWMLTSKRMPTAAELGGKDRAGQTLAWVTRLYEAWHSLEPEAGHDATAEQWRQRLEQYRAKQVAAEQAATRPSP